MVHCRNKDAVYQDFEGFGEENVTYTPGGTQFMLKEKSSSSPVNVRARPIDVGTIVDGTVLRRRALVAFVRARPQY
jgi:hypothetical protein